MQRFDGGEKGRECSLSLIFVQLALKRTRKFTMKFRSCFQLPHRTHRADRYVGSVSIRKLFEGLICNIK